MVVEEEKSGQVRGIYRKEHRQGSHPGVEDETGWKLMSYIWGLLCGKSQGVIQMGP